MVIKISVVGKRTTVDGVPIIVCGNSDYSIKFTFDAEWSAHTLKTARFVFHKNGQVQYQDVPFSGTTVAVPVLSDIREVYVGVYAGDLCTTTPARITCDKSILCGTGEDHGEPDPDVYNQILAACNELIKVAGNHPTRTDNPHKVTAEQVGARPNTWLPTIAEIGAAPAGYGSGTKAKTLATFAELDTTLLPGKYFVNAGATGMITVDSYGIGYANVDVCGVSDGWVTQRMNPYNTGYWLQRKISVNGTIDPWEWDNPPMIPGVEYRTTERCNGKVVYAKAINMGVMPNNSTIDVHHNISNLGYVIERIGTAPGYSFPVHWGNTSVGSVEIYVNASRILLSTTADWSASSCIARLKYTKTTD